MLNTGDVSDCDFFCKTAASREYMSSGFLTRSNTNWVVQSQNMARGLKFRIYNVEGLCYLCSKNKGADQRAVTANCAAELRLYIGICKRQVSHEAAQMIHVESYRY